MQDMKVRTVLKLQVSCMLWLCAAGLATIAALYAVGQENAAPQAKEVTTQLPAFDVVSIKPHKSGDGMIRVMFTPDGVSYTGIPMQMLLRDAFGIEEDRLLGAPGWARTNRYDIESKVQASDAPRLKDLTADQRRSMLVPVLVDRFSLKFHHETKELPEYALVIAKGGSKLKEVKPVDPGPSGDRKPSGRVFMNLGRLEAQSASLGPLMHILSQQLGRTVQDKTGLTGSYDYTLNWTPDDAPPPMAGGPEGGPPRNDSANQSDAAGPALFTALQEQLGLKLESQKGPVDVIVIDHIEAPSAN